MKKFESPAPAEMEPGLDEATVEPGIVSVGDHYTEGNVHLISNYWGLDSFLDTPVAQEPMDVAFVTTASRPYPEHNTPRRFLDAERAWLEKQKEDGRLTYEEVCIFGKNGDQVHDELEDADVIFMGGGNTQYLTEQLHETGADEVIRGLVTYEGKWYLGKSAGAIVAGPDIDPRGFLLPSMANGEVEDTTGLALVDVYPMPHIDTPSVMDQEYEGKTGWQHAIEMSRLFRLAYILDNARKPKNDQ